MLKRVGFTIALGLLISYPLVAATAFDTGGLAKPSKLATLRIAVDQETGVTYTELLGDFIPDKAGGPGDWGSCLGDLQIHQIAGQYTVCPTCNNCPDLEDKTRGEILFMCLCFQPSDTDMMVIPTAGQRYGFELVPYTGSGLPAWCYDDDPDHLCGSATAATVEVVCAQQPPTEGYEFDHLQHCGVAISVTVNSCEPFEVWYDVKGTVWDSTP